MERAIIKVTYGGVEITYDEFTNQWVFELRGRERKVGSLSKAKENIDAPEPVKKKPFTHIPAMMQAESWARKEISNFEKVDITSVAARSYGDMQVWIVRQKNGVREKVSIHRVYENTPENLARIAHYDNLSASRDALNESLEKVQKAMKEIVLPEELTHG